ncbi:MAG TPA: hypothetical protein PLT26_11590 [Anaerolineaceae bacterium]|nr:hypothetical protein [Anaerolineaceae bacterium]HQH86120.1 hypothetical protein [Anaerolineaceae bacterium]
MSDDKIEQMLSEIKQSLNQLRISRSAGTSIGGSVNVNDGGDFVAHDQYNLQQNIQIITLDYFAPRIRDRLLECKSLSEMDDILMQIPDRIMQVIFCKMDQVIPRFC